MLTFGCSKRGRKLQWLGLGDPEVTADMQHGQELEQPVVVAVPSAGKLQRLQRLHELPCARVGRRERGGPVGGAEPRRAVGG
jgi:hypothetical protein